MCIEIELVLTWYQVKFWKWIKKFLQNLNFNLTRHGLILKIYIPIIPKTEVSLKRIETKPIFYSKRGNIDLIFK